MAVKGPVSGAHEADANSAGLPGHTRGYTDFLAHDVTEKAAKNSNRPGRLTLCPLGQQVLRHEVDEDLHLR